jgi:hypothetical protein
MMSALATFWRCSLLATALCALLGSAPAPAAADDTPPTAAERDKLQEKFRAIRERAAQLDKEGKHDDAERLRRESYEIMKKAGGGMGVSTVVSSTSTNPEVDKIRGLVKEMIEKAGQLDKDGKHDEAELLRHHARELYSKLNPHASASFTVNAVSPERQKLYEQYQALHEKIEAAKKAGNEEAVHHYMQELDAVRGKLRSQEGTAAYHPATTDRDARLQHLRAAVEQLKAAGCEPEAQHVIDMIHRMEAEARAKAAETSSARYEGRTTPSPYHSGDAVSPAMVQELRGQIEQMRKEIRQMHEELNRAKSGDRP